LDFGLTHRRTVEELTIRNNIARIEIVCSRQFQLCRLGCANLCPPVCETNQPGHQRYDNDHRHRGNQHHLDTGRPVRLTPETLQSIDRTVPTIAFPVPIAEASAHLPTL